MKILISYLLIAFILTACQNAPKQKGREQARKCSQYSDLKKDQLLDTIQYQTFNYFWEGAEPNSGMARERIHLDGIYPEHDENIVTVGGSGFGLMAILVGVKNNFISRQQALERFIKIVNFLAKADRFHGAWPHWLDGRTGKVKPFSPKDDGGDIVETAFMVQGLLTVAEYFKNGSKEELQLVEDINKLWKQVEWNWYTKNNEDVIYWHWSPKYNWEMNFPVRGYNECLILYILAASSPTFPVNAEVYHKGWALGGKISNDTIFLGIQTILNYFDKDNDPVGPLFWAHYSYLGLNPTGLSDKYANYWKLNQNLALIHYSYALENPKNFKGYGCKQWGFTASYSMNGYEAHRPGKYDLGVISPTAALSSFPYTPKESMQFLKYLYQEADSLVGKYGPYDAYSISGKWCLPRYLAIDQGPIPVMIENYKSGLLWKLFMQNKDISHGLKKLGFTSPFIGYD